MTPSAFSAQLSAGVKLALLLATTWTLSATGQTTGSRPAAVAQDRSFESCPPALTQDRQPEGKRGQQEAEGARIAYDHITSWEEGGERLGLLTGSVELTTAGTSLRADRALVWTRPDEPTTKLHEIYLEGNVVYRRTDPKTKREVTLRADRMYYDFVEHRAYIMELTARAYMERLRSPLILRAQEARELSRGKWIAKNVVVTTCTYGDPHYHVRFDTGYLQGEKLKESTNPYDIWPYENWSVRGEGISADIFGLPVFFWPVLAFGSAVSEFPIRAVRGGHSRRFGYWVETDWAVSIPKGVIDALNPFDSSTAEDDKEKWGELRWEYDWRSRRGNAGGIDLVWHWSNYQGYIDTYYIRDAGGDPDIDFDAQFLPLEHHERGRARLFHRQELAEGLRAEVEVSYLSDRNLLPEFFPTEFKEGKEQETVGYIRWEHDIVAAYLLERNRLNDFQTQNEFLPQARAFLYDLPVELGITYSMQLDAARIRRRFDEDLHLESEEVIRVDVVNELARPIDLGIATVAPFVRARETIYDEDLQGDTAYRFLGTAGVRVSTQLTGVHDISWEAIGLRRLRHIALFEVTYASTLENTVDPSELFPFDGVDQLDEFEEISIEMRHRFQTKVKDGDKFVTHEFLTLGAAIEYYPNDARDTTSLNANNIEDPFHWITIAPHDSSGVLERRHWSNLHYDLRLEPRNYFTLRATGEYNPVEQQEEVREYSIELKPTNTISASVGEEFVRDVTTAFTVGLDWRITEKWHIEARGQYDFDLDQWLNWRVSLSRDLHDFIVELVAEVSETRDERRVYVTAYPKFLRRVR